ncbi:MAG: hypothetical protein JWQ93_834 [Marmoricola sp.]|jgi:hypothetical protein|nr:hypothetical protein [Marmoricola sp.]MCW2836188.1 hypothetical protein [Marmoricola sp.]
MRRIGILAIVTSPGPPCACYPVVRRPETMGRPGVDWAGRS